MTREQALDPIGLKSRLKQLFWIVLMVVLLAELLARMLFVLAKPEATYHKEFDRRLAMVQKDPDLSLPKATTNTVFLMGDSRMMVGGYSEYLQSLLAEQNVFLNILNTSVSGGTPHMNLFMLKQAQKVGYRPKLIIYSIKDLLINKTDAPHILEGSPESKLANSYVGRCLYTEHKSWMGQATCTLEQYSYLARGRRHFKNYLGLLDLALFQPQKYQQVPYTLNTPDWEISAMGWAPGYTILNTQNAARVFKISEDSLLKKTQHQTQQVWADKDWQEFLDYTQAQNIPVIFVWVPEYQTKKLLTNKLVRQRYVLITQHYKQYSQKYANVFFKNFLTSDQNINHYYNRHHINVLGAKQFTENLAKLLLDPSFKGYLKGGG